MSFEDHLNKYFNDEPSFMYCPVAQTEVLFDKHLDESSDDFCSECYLEMLRQTESREIYASHYWRICGLKGVEVE